MENSTQTDPTEGTSNTSSKHLKSGPSQEFIDPEASLADENRPDGASRRGVKTTELPKALLTPAEETGQKVGKFVTNLLEENPELQERVNQLDLDTMMANPASVANRLRDSFQQSRLFRMMPRWVDRRITAMFPRDMEPAAEDVMKWLRTKSDNTLRLEASRPNLTEASRFDIQEEAPAKKSWLSRRRNKEKHPHQSQRAKSGPSKVSIEELLGSLDAAPASRSSRLGF